MNNLHIVTVATESKYYFPYLVESCKRHGQELEVLGYGEKWQGFNHKFQLMYNYLKKLPPTDIVCFVDGYDVLCVRDLNELKTEFIKTSKEKKCKIIVAQDKHTNYFFDFIHPYIFGTCKNLHLNSGTYIGYVSDVLDIIKTIYESNPDKGNDDQKLLTEYCNHNEKQFYIDVKNKFFFTQLSFLSEIYNYVNIKNNDEVVVNHEKPFFIHVPHGYLDNLIIKLGYNYDYNNKINNQIFVEEFTKKIWKGALKNYIIIFLVIIILIIIYQIFKGKIFYTIKNYKFNFLKKNKK